MHVPQPVSVKGVNIKSEQTLILCCCFTVSFSLSSLVLWDDNRKRKKKILWIICYFIISRKTFLRSLLGSLQYHMWTLCVCVWKSYSCYPTAQHFNSLAYTHHVIFNLVLLLTYIILSFNHDTVCESWVDELNSQLHITSHTQKSRLMNFLFYCRLPFMFVTTRCGSFVYVSCFTFIANKSQATSSLMKTSTYSLSNFISTQFYLPWLKRW